MSEEFIVYPLDLTGVAATNKVVGSYNITKMSGELYYQFACRQGPFFKKGAELWHIQSNQKLRYGIDFVFSYYSKTLSEYSAHAQENSISSEVYYAVVLQNRRLTGTLKLICNVVGGEFSTNIAFIGASVNENSEYASTSYDDIVDVPAVFTPGSHGVDTKELTTGFDAVVESLKSISASLDNLASVEGTQISDVEGLADALNGLVDYKGGAKVKLTDISHVSASNFKSQIKVTLPKNAELSALVSAKLRIVSVVGEWEVDVSGMVNRNGVFGNAWSQGVVRITGNNTAGLLVRMTYNNEKQPVIYIGDSNTLLGYCHISLVDYTTSSALADTIVAGWAIDFSADNINTITLPTINYPNTHGHSTSQLTGNPIIPKVISNSVNLNTLIDNDYRIYTPGFTDPSKMLALNYPVADSDFSLKVVYTNNKSIKQTVNYTNGRTFSRIINNQGVVQRDWDEIGLVTEDKYIIPSGSNLRFLGEKLDTAKAFTVTLIGSKLEGDVYQAILHYVNNNWVAVVTTMGRENPTLPVLKVIGTNIIVVCNDSTKTDESIKAIVAQLI